MPGVKIRTEREVTTRPSIDVELRRVAMTYQVEGSAPRVVWIDKAALPDLMYISDNPGATEAPEEEVRRGDLTRLKAIWDDQAALQKRRVTRPFSY